MERKPRLNNAYAPDSTVPKSHCAKRKIMIKSEIWSEIIMTPTQQSLAQAIIINKFLGLPEQKPTSRITEKGILPL